MENHLVLRDFVDHWDNLVRPTRFSTAIFHCTVTYSFKRKTVTDKTKALIQRTGYEDGKVSLVETDTLTAERFHMDFSPDYQSYSLTPDKLLRIDGKSPKMGGAYSVTIFPLGACQPGEYP